MRENGSGVGTARNPMLLLLLFLFILSSCLKDKWTEDVAGESPLRSIGSDNDRSALDYFGRIDCIEIDPKNNIYVFDYPQASVKRISWDGTQIVSLIGEDSNHSITLSNPRTIAVDTLGTLYISDGALNRIIAFDSHGDSIGVVNTLNTFGTISAIDWNHIYVSRATINGWSHPQLLWHSLDGVKHGECITPTKYTQAWNLSGRPLTHDVTLLGTIVVCQKYPYQLILLSSDLHEMRRWEGNAKWNVPTPRMKGYEVRLKDGDIPTEVVCGNDGLIYVRVQHKRKGILTTTLDIYTTDGHQVGEIHYSRASHCM